MGTDKENCSIWSKRLKPKGCKENKKKNTSLYQKHPYDPKTIGPSKYQKTLEHDSHLSLCLMESSKVENACSCGVSFDSSSSPLNPF